MSDLATFQIEDWFNRSCGAYCLFVSYQQADGKLEVTFTVRGVDGALVISVIDDPKRGIQNKIYKLAEMACDVAYSRLGIHDTYMKLANQMARGA